jgi:hypothetical protein
MIDNSAVAIAAITLAGTSVAGLIWVIKYAAKTLSKDLRAHTKASTELEKTVKQVGREAKLSAKNSMELLTFMKSLNGRLPKIIHESIEEERKK